MRIPARSAFLSAFLATAFAAGGVLAGPLATRDGPEPGAAPAVPSCRNSCRGLGVEKVKAGDEHCGLVPRERKDESLDVACALARSHREDLERRAEKRARDKCSAELGEAACECRSELRPWQNVYTHVLSQRCWTECGWAFLVDCERAAEPDG